MPTADNSSSTPVKPSPTSTPTTKLKTSYSSTTSKETILNDYKAFGGKEGLDLEIKAERTVTEDTNASVIYVSGVLCSGTKTIALTEKDLELHMETKFANLKQDLQNKEIKQYTKGELRCLMFGCWA
ncbi:hypothetical protein BC351_32605 [Paenibacillus ferrarius]|uniref:Uncharacterized protein n=1 Tax=Paenibacillus ferrarius TaxID=1469647 RepID=A0A1V4HFZ3_9BACL|nr:hypothetical protein [Paenibacillus ferrarius]OPH53000.1 hypothetical protein BC351_32605 [Paenibacillus ferrarius]